MHEYIKYFDKIRIMLISDSTVKQKMKVKKDFSIEAHSISNRRDRMIDIWPHVQVSISLSISLITDYWTFIE
jgi:hypothetical protein